MSETNAKKVGYKDIFHQKEYMKIIIAALINRFGDAIDAVASTWIVYELTGNAAWSAIIFGLNRLPSVVVTPFAGAWVEGKDKKKIMVVTDLIRALCVGIVATGYLGGFLQAWMLVFTTLTISTVEAFRGPASVALTPHVLEKKYYEYAMSLMATLSSIIEIIGMAMAAGIIALVGTAGAIYIDMITFLLSALIIAAVRSKESKKEKVKFNWNEYKGTLVEGAVYAQKQPIVKTLIVLCVFMNAVLVPFNSLQAPLSNEILGGGAEIISILGIAATVGMMLGSITYPMVCSVIKEKTICFLGGLGIGIYYVAMIVCKPLFVNKAFMYVFVAVMSAAFGYFITLTTSYMSIVVVKRVDENYLARVDSIMSAFGSAATPIVSWIVGAIVSFTDTKMIFMITGIVDMIFCMGILRCKALDEEEETASEECMEQAIE